MATITSNTRYHGQIRQLSWPVLLVTESTRDLTSATAVEEDGYVAESPFGFGRLTLCASSLLYIPVTDWEVYALVLCPSQG